MVQITSLFPSFYHFGAEKLNSMMIGADFVKKLIFRYEVDFLEQLDPFGAF